MEGASIKLCGRVSSALLLESSAHSRFGTKYVVRLSSSSSDVIKSAVVQLSCSATEAMTFEIGLCAPVT